MMQVGLEFTDTKQVGGAGRLTGGPQAQPWIGE
jgi:hypothetical protein